MNLSRLSEDALLTLFKVFNRFMVLLWRLGLGSWGNATRYGGYVMVIRHLGRKTGSIHHTPVNYALIDGDIYCTAGFGRRSDWYRNIMLTPTVEVWLPDGRWAGVAEDVTELKNRAGIFRQLIVASGFAGPLFGVDARRASDDDLEGLLARYRLVRIKMVAATSGRGGPGDLAWVWPLSTIVLLLSLLAMALRK